MRRKLTGRLVAPDGAVRAVVVTIDAGRVEAVDAGTVPSGPLLVPGFVDIQVNGVDDVDCRQADEAGWRRLDTLLAAQGTTAWCPTLITAPLPSYDRPLSSIRAAMTRPDRGRPRILGAHLEGPFLGGAPGAHDVRHIVPVDQHWIDGIDSTVRVVTIAPECPGAIDAITRLRRRGITVAIGHSTPTDPEIEAAVAAGATLVTHLFNGMPPLHHRRLGLAGHALSDDRLVTSIIADGVHVDLRLVKTAFRSKRRGGIVLVTDAVAWRDPAHVAAGVRVVDGAPRLPDGTLAGSGLTMIDAVAAVIEAGVSVPDALAAATSTPARLVGHDGGSIDAGAPADIVIVDDDAWLVNETLVAGATAHER